MLSATLDLPQPVSSLALSISDFMSVAEDELLVEAIVADADAETGRPGFLLQAQRVADKHPTAAALARLAKAELDIGNRVSSLRAARSVAAAATASEDAGALIVAADVALACGDLELAQAILSVAAGAPVHAALASRVALLAARNGDVGLALELLDATRSAADPVSWELRGLMQLKLGDFGGAIHSLRHAIRSEVSSIDAHINLTYAYASVGSMDKALRSAKTAFALAPTSKLAGVNLVAVYDSCQEYALAASVLDQLMKVYPTDAHLHFGHAELVSRIGGVNKALDHLRRLRTLDWFRQAGECAHAELDALIAMFRRAKGEIERGEAFRTVLKAAGRADYRSEHLARQLGDVAGGASEAEDLELAIELFEGRVEPADLYSARVALARIRDDGEKALELLEEWAACDPSNANLWIVWSVVELQRFDFNAAVRRAQQGLDRFPAHPILLNNLAFALALSGRPADARRIPQGDPESVMSQATDAAIAMAAGDLEPGRARYASIATSLRRTSPEWAQVVLIYRAFTTLVLTGRIGPDDDITLPPELRDDATLHQLVRSIQSRLLQG